MHGRREGAPITRGRETRLRYGVRWLAAIGIAAALAAGGCGRGRPSGATEIVYWTGWSGHELEVQERLVAEFNRTHPRVHVRILSQFGISGYQKVRIAFAGGATPDVMSTVWADELAGYARRRVLEPLDGYLRASGRDIDREFTPGVARMLRVDGSTWALAVTTNTTFIAYNRRIFASVGLDPNRPPRTIEELDRCADRCTLTDAHGNYTRVGFRPTGLVTWAYVFGGQWYDPATRRVTASDPHNVAALRWLASYARRYDLRRMDAFQSTFGSMETPNGPFFVGKIAMWSTGEWAEQFIARCAPGLDWGWFALPSPPGGRSETSTAGGSVFVIPAACRHRREAWEFLDWISRPAAVETFCAGIGNVPPLVQVGLRPRFQAGALSRFAVRVAQGPHTFGPPPIAIWPTYSREILRTEEAVVLGGADPGRALGDLQRRMTAEMARSDRELAR